MATTDSKELKVLNKQEMAVPAEQTKPGLVFTPNVDIYDTENAIHLVADMPGVEPANLTIDLRDDVLTFTGDISPGGNANESVIYTEYQTGRFYRQFSLSEVIDQSKIDAKLNDGVLSLVLPKVEKATPRKITVHAQ
jgi:HSP20 family protein